MTKSTIKKNPFIADLHCDLLCYLQGNDKRTAYDEDIRCSISQMHEGNVKLQTMAVFTETSPGSSQSGSKQIQIFKQLPKLYSDEFEIANKSLKTPSSQKIGIMLAIENGSSLVEESEDLEAAFEKLSSMEEDLQCVVYISLTWNTENRFGGGAHSNKGLKIDGKRMLEFLHKKNIAIDLSHTSDKLAFDILNYIDQHSLDLPVIASHSNFRAVTNVSRNLPDELAKEIITRKGVIGLNFVREFIGASDLINFSKHLEHMLKLGGEKHLCFGADFYFSGDLPPQYFKPKEMQFFPGFDSSASYAKVMELWKDQLKLTDSLLKDIAHQNYLDFLKSR